MDEENRQIMWNTYGLYINMDQPYVVLFTDYCLLVFSQQMTAFAVALLSFRVCPFMDPL